MSNDEIQKQILDAITTGKIKAANIILGDNVQNKIDKVESGGIGVKIVHNGILTEESTASEESSPKGKRGPKEVNLFVNENDKDGVSREKEERNRFKSYISGHKLGSRKLSSSKDDVLLKTIVCFFMQWKKRGYVNPDAGGMAIVRFITEKCDIDHSVDRVSIANKLGLLLSTQEYDKEIMGDVSGYF